MMKSSLDDQQKLCMLAFLFDSGRIESSTYGEKVFEYIIKGKEVVNNTSKVVVSVGDILEREIYNDITPFIIKDELCTIGKANDKHEDSTPFISREELLTFLNTDKKYDDYIFGVLIEDISINTAKK